MEVQEWLCHHVWRKVKLVTETVMEGVQKRIKMYYPFFKSDQRKNECILDFSGAQEITGNKLGCMDGS